MEIDCRTCLALNNQVYVGGIMIKMCIVGDIQGKHVIEKHSETCN
jgi:hypothetical protein